MSPLDRIAAHMAMLMVARVVTTYADGSSKHHDVRSLGAAENWAIGELRKIGRDLINRETGKPVRVVSVEIQPL